MRMFFIFASFLFVYIYVSVFKQSYKSEKNDILNQRLFSLNFCGWNILHIIFNYLVCVFFKVKSLTEYLLVFAIGIIWFFVEQIVFMRYNKRINQNVRNDAKYVYSSISHPRYDDIIFNLIGILLYSATKQRLIAS